MCSRQRGRSIASAATTAPSRARPSVSVVHTPESIRACLCYYGDMPPQEPLFNKQQILWIKVVLGTFIISSAGTLLADLTGQQFFSSFQPVWFVGASAGFVLVVSGFLGGIVNVFRNKGLNLFLSSILLALVFGLVGYGTCSFNLSGLN